MTKPSSESHAAFFQRYIDQVPEDNFLTAFENQSLITSTFLNSISEEKSSFAYAEKKWTLKELLQHIIDTERILCYRALCIARHETASLPGFDENGYAAHSNANSRNWDSMVKEFQIVRIATELLFRSFSDEALLKTGTANGNLISVKSLGYIISGHFYHHKKVIEERYL